VRALVSPPERKVQTAPSVKRDVSWEGLNRLVQDALASRSTRADAGTLSDPAVDTDRQLLDSLDGLKEDGALRWWNRSVFVPSTISCHVITLGANAKGRRLRPARAPAAPGRWRTA
jgi:hypothetical protein